MKAKPINNNSCSGKIRYDTISESNKQVKNLNKNRKHKKVKTYKCCHCGGYHYGHDVHRRMKNQTHPTYIPEYHPNEVTEKVNLDIDKILNIKLNYFKDG